MPRIQFGGVKQIAREHNFQFNLGESITTTWRRKNYTIRPKIQRLTSEFWLELNQSKDGTYLGEWKPREKAAEGPVELVLPESEHATDSEIAELEKRGWERIWAVEKMRKVRKMGMVVFVSSKERES